MWDASWIGNLLRGCTKCVQRYGLLATGGYLFDLFRVARAERSEAFDVRFDTVTAQKEYPWELPSLKHKSVAEIHPYEAVSVRLFQTILSSLSIESGGFTFVDLGSGKGRALLLAAQYPFRKIIGIEISRELHRVAKTNVDRYIGFTRNSIYELRCMDATTYEFGPDPMVLFLFNPFGNKTFRAVLSHLEESIRKWPREVVIVYINPRFERVLQKSIFRRIARGGSRLQPWSRYVVYEAKR